MQVSIRSRERVRQRAQMGPEAVVCIGLRLIAVRRPHRGKRDCAPVGSGLARACWQAMGA